MLPLVFSLLLPVVGYSADAPLTFKDQTSGDDDFIAAAVVDKASDQKEAAAKDPALPPEDRRKAIADLNKVIAAQEEQHPKSPIVKLSVARDAYRSHDYQKGIERAEQAAALAEARQDPKALVQALLTGAVGYGRTGDYPKAYAAAVEALRRDPKGPYAASATAILQLTKGRPAHLSSGLHSTPASRAEDHAYNETLAATSPLNDPRVRQAGQAALNHLKAIAHLDQAMAALKVGDPESALAATQKAYALDPRIPDIYMQRAFALVALKRLPAAIDELGKAVKLWTERGAGGRSLVAAHNTRSMLAADVKDFPLALADAEAALTLDPGSAQAYFNRARAKEGLDAKASEVFADFKRAAALDPARFSADYQAALARYKDSGRAGPAAPPDRPFWGIVALGAVLVLLVAALWRRRRAGPTQPS